MRRTLPAIALLALALSACTAERTPDAEAPVAAQPAATDAPASPEAPQATSPEAVAIPASGDARMDGYGALDFGMTAEEAKAAWTDGALEGAAPAEGSTCLHLAPAGQPTPAHLAFMFEDDLLVRYSSEADDIAAPGGGKRGMDEAALQALYGNALQSSPHKYVEGGKVLSTAPDGGLLPSKLVFELDAAGKVSEWRVGMPPQVDYVEGCS